MERIKQNKLLTILALFLFLLPFFWFKPGEMDLGGDSSRLYFYDPIAYLKNYSFYAISPSSFGAENIGYFMLPFVGLLYGLKLLFQSPTILITFFHGISFLVAFLSIYGIVTNLLSDKFEKQKENIRLAGIIAGLFYLFSQTTMGGWDKVLVTHNQIFLNPLLFYLFLRYFQTSIINYLLVSLLISFIFAPNFGFAAAPPFFAFYPLSFCFLLIYTVFFLKKKIIWKHIIITIIGFITLQAFHLLPQLISALSPGSSFNTTIFTEEGKIDRGLSYFMSIAPHVKVSLSLLNLPQLTELTMWAYASIIFPIVILYGFILKRSKLLLLTGVFFLITLFFAAANITATWLEIYRKLFDIPGFSMFRNFYGQWGTVFLFFYTLLFAQALVVVLEKTRRNYKNFLISVLILALIIPAIPFIKGDLMDKKIWLSNDIKIFMKMDPQYAKSMEYVRDLPADGKVLTFPLTDPGYQIVMGENNGAYQGPSTVSYLAGKKDFAGFIELGVFTEEFKELVETENYEGLKKLFTLLNIKYIFYNANPLVYEKGFPTFPYDEARKFLPTDQAAYQEFLEKLELRKLKQFGSVSIYEVAENEKNSEISFPNQIIPTEKNVVDWNYYINGYDISNNSLAFVPVDNTERKNAIIEVHPIKQSDLQKKDYPIEVVFPFIRWSPQSPFYPLVQFKEQDELKKVATANEKIYIHLAFATKRIAELANWGSSMNDEEWKKSLTQYSGQMDSAIKTLKQEKDSMDIEMWLIAASKVDQAFIAHKIKINDSIANQEQQKQQSLYRIAENTLEKIQKDLPQNYTPKTGILYHLTAYDSKVEKYQASITYDTLDEEILRASFLEINGKEYPVEEIDKDNKSVSYGEIELDSSNDLAVLHVNEKVVDDSQEWQRAEGIISNDESVGDINNGSTVSQQESLIKEIKDWKGNATYVISFDYNTHGKSVEMALFTQGLRKESDIKDPPPTALFRERKNTREWTTFTIIVDSDATRWGKMIISGFSQEDTNISIKNFKATEQISPPHLRFKLNEEMLQNVTIPNNTVEKINSTQYRLNITESEKPYYIAMSNQFSNNWKMYLVDANQGNSLWSPFATFGKKPVANVEHFMINGFANGWYVSPEDIKQKNYTLVLAYQTQDYFYLGLIISGISFIILVLILLSQRIKKFKKINSDTSRKHNETKNKK